MGLDVVGGAALLLTPFAAVGAGMIGAGVGSLAGGYISEEKLGGSYELGAFVGNLVGGVAGSAAYSKISSLRTPNNMCEPKCFVAGTMIALESGQKPIEGIVVGDKVLSKNEETGEVAVKTVKQVFISECNELIHVMVNGETITTTPMHPFYVAQFGWIKAINLRAGDVLVLSNGEYVVVEQIQHEILEAPVMVYNFEVEDFHTYFVGESAILVHNTCAMPENTLNDGLGTYAEQRGHHPMAKRAFEGVNGYNSNKALTISQSKLNQFGVKHGKITGQQNSLYSAYAKTGQPLTMDAMRQIEIKAMTNAGIPANYATNAVGAAVKQLKEWGITQPVRIPWN